MSRIESTCKDRDLEEVLDVYFYRPFGYVLASLGRSFRVSPNLVTVLSMVVGVVAGHLFYYPSLRLNVLGIFGLIFSEALDSADGQLARMTGQKSKLGRVLDGVAGNVIFISIYVHICLRYVSGGGSWAIFALAAPAGVCHSFQGAIADFYRNAYLYFVRGPSTSEFEDSEIVVRQYATLTWRQNIIKKFLMRVYLNYARQQELLTKGFLRLKQAARGKFGGEIPAWLANEYARRNGPMIKYYNILTVNTRMLVLFLLLLLKRPYWFFVFEMVILNGLLILVVVKEERISRDLLAKIVS